jgi:hypothetical protein
MSVETFEKIKHLLTFFMAKPRENSEVMLKQYELRIDGDMHTVINSFFKNLLNIATP